MVFRKVDLGQSKLTCPTSLLVDQSSPDFFADCGRNHCRSHVSDFDISIRSGDIHARSLKLSNIRAEFCTFLAPKFFWGGRLEFFYLVIKLNSLLIMWQFQGDRRGSLEILRLKNKRKETAVKHKTSCY